MIIHWSNNTYVCTRPRRCKAQLKWHRAWAFSPTMFFLRFSIRHLVLLQLPLSQHYKICPPLPSSRIRLTRYSSSADCNSVARNDFDIREAIKKLLSSTCSNSNRTSKLALGAHTPRIGNHAAFVAVRCHVVEVPVFTALLRAKRNVAVCRTHHSVGDVRFAVPILVAIEVGAILAAVAADAAFARGHICVVCGTYCVGWRLVTRLCSSLLWWHLTPVFVVDIVACQARVEVLNEES